MTHRYTREKLLWLRQSPLVSKPVSLPPVEEWMGAIPDPSQIQNQRGSRIISRGKNEEPGSSEVAAARRPGLESKAKSSVNPENIVLGPPRTSFASTGRKSGNALDIHPRQGLSSQDDDIQKHGEGFKERPPKDSTRYERNGEQARDVRPGTRSRGEKSETDNWSRGQRTSGQEYQDHTFSKVGDREFDKDRRDDRRPREFIRDGARATNGDGAERRGWEPRSRNQPSWARDENLKDAAGPDGESSRVRGWREKEPRRDHRGQDKYWDRGAKQETDPEWMDEPEPEEKKKAYTADDFEQWKAKMKAGNGVGQAPPVESKTTQQLNDDDTFMNAASPVAKSAAGKDSRPPLLESDFDGFFGLGKQDSISKEQQENGVPRNASGASGKGSKASKFSNLFTAATKPVPPVAEQPREPAPTPANDSSDADKEGFARILSLLGGQQQPPPPPPPVEKGTPSRAKSQQKTSISSPVHSPPPDMYNRDPFSGMLNQQSPPPVNQTTHNVDQQFLLGLMQQQQQQQQQQPQPPRPETHAGNRRLYDGPPNGSFANMTISPGDHTRQQSNGPPPGFMQDIFRDDFPRDKLNPTTSGEQRRPPPGFPDMGFPPPGMARPSPQPPGFPPGMRPPGFDMPPQQQQQQRHNPNMGPPPGFPPGMQRGQGAAFPPGIIPGMQDRQQQQFGVRQNGPGMPLPPLPPGFMGGPPPGFPNMPFAQDGGGIPFGGGGFADFGPNGPQQGFSRPAGRR